MRGRAGWLGACVLLGLVAAGCQTEPYTEWRERPDASRTVPPAGHPVYAAVLERTDTKLDGRTLPPEADVTRSYARILRRAGVFTDVLGPEYAGRAGAAGLRLRSDLGLEQKAAGNVGRSVLVALSLGLLRSSLPFRLDLDGEMEFDVRLPGEAEARRYRSRSGASRFYFYASQYHAALAVVMREVTTENFRAIVAELRSERALTAAPDFEERR